MEAKEKLMKGNKLHFIVKPKKEAERPELVTVIEFTRRGILCDYQGVDIFFEHGAPDLCGIELNPDILVKAGFKHGMVEGITRLRDADDTYEEEGDTHYWDLRVPKNDIAEGLSTFNLVKFGNDDITFSNQWLRVKLFYLHQLQNLFFALTGTELSINL